MGPFIAAAVFFVAPSASIAERSAAAAAPKATTVSELVVTATKSVAELTVTAKAQCLPPQVAERATRPKVVSSFPQKGQVVRPGLLVIRVTFDQPMACSGVFTPDAPREDPCPGERREMLLSLDRRTVRTVCIVEAGKPYGAWVTRDPVAHSFVGLGGLPSEAYRLAFTTSDAPPVNFICEALLEDDETAPQVRARAPANCGG